MRSLLLTTTLLFCSILCFAQQEYAESPHTISAQLGYGWFGLFNNTIADITVNEDGNGNSDTYTATFNGSPATTIAYDYRVGRIFSLGGAVGFQSLNLKDFSNAQTNENISGELGINRVFLSARTLFHYGKNPKWDMYSGVRVGATVWNVNSTVDKDEFIIGEGVTLKSGTLLLPHLVPIPFGVKYYPNERLMVGAELATGSPHFFALQLGVRL